MKIAKSKIQEVDLKSSSPPFEKNNTRYFRSKTSIFIKVDVLLITGSKQDPVEPKIISAQQNRKNPF